MYVEPAYRGKGINQMIIAALKTWAYSRNVTELRLDVYHDNANAIKAYEKIFPLPETNRINFWRPAAVGGPS